VLQRLESPDAERAFQMAERARIEAALEELVERDYLLQMPDSTVPGESEYIFKHNLEHDLVLTLVPPERARRYFRVVAEWLETRLPPDERDQTGEQLEYQASLYQHQITMLKKIPSLAGLSPWVLMDFHSPRRLLPGTQDYYNRKGLVSNLGQHKQAFYMLQKYYRELDSTQ